MILSRIWYLIIVNLLIWFPYSLFAQNDAILEGRIMTPDNIPISGATVTIDQAGVITSSDDNGVFTISPIATGNYELTITAPGYKEKNITAVVDQKFTKIGVIKLDIDDQNRITDFQERLPSINVTNNASADDDGGSSPNVSGLLNASQDPFVRIASYNFGPLRFNIRGYNSSQSRMMINNILMNDAFTGNVIWGQWGGLNDVFRSRTFTQGLFPSEMNFGGLYGTSNIDASASNQRKQIRFSYSATNRTYRNRAMLTYSSGLLPSGWAFSVSGSVRWSQEGYVPGTYYNGNSYYIAVDKAFNTKHKIGIIFFGSPTLSGKMAPVVEETFDLAGKYYNPNWGYQSGKKRNAKDHHSNQPISILNYTYTPNNNNILYVSLSNQFGINSNSTLDWFKAPDPRPDYYRKLPSYLTDSTEKANLTAAIKSNPSSMQIDWQKLYNANYSSYDSVIDGNGNVLKTGRWARYLIGAFVEKIDKWTFNTTWLHAIDDHITTYTGLMYQNQVTENYKELLDLLGADFGVNVNQFAERQYVNNNRLSQYDLNNPNGIVNVGDKYNYHYNSIVSTWQLWHQWVMKYNRVDGFISFRYENNQYQRDGLYRSGLFSNNSYGKSPRVKFNALSVKGGITYKINGRNYVYLNAAMIQDAPQFENTYISPMANNYTIGNPKLIKTLSTEFGYKYISPNFKAIFNGYITDMNHNTDIIRFFNDDENAFVNYVLNNIDNRDIGLEIGLEGKINSSWSVTGAIALGQHFYTNNPTVTVYNQNDTSVTALKSSGQTVYFKNYANANAGPQTALGLGISYNSKKYWFVTLNFNYLDKNYVTIAPTRHTALAVDGLPLESKERAQILNQEKLPSAFTMDFFGGKSWIVHKNKDGNRRTMLFLNLGINNLLNNKNIFTGGFEQLRLNPTNLNAFGNKYFRAFGLNYFLNLSLSI